MSKQQPQRIPISSLQELLESGIRIDGIQPFVFPNFAVLHRVNSNQVIKGMFSMNVPYRVDDFRFLFFHQGNVRIVANLLEVEVSGGTIGFMGNGGIVQFEDISPLVEVSGIVLKGDFLNVVMNGHLPNALNGSVRNFYVKVKENEMEIVERMIVTMRMILEDADCNSKSVASLLAAAINYICSLYERYGNCHRETQTRVQDMFKKFIVLVNEHGSRHHTLDFYADRLCVTKRYLGTLVHKVSGVKAKEWIDRAIITDAKVALKHSDISVSQLSEELRFPTPSFFCKFFKRMTGTTPAGYRSE